MTDTAIPGVALLIDGQFVQSKTTQWRNVVNPATQQVLARVPVATPDEVAAAMRGDDDARFIAPYCPVIELGLVGRTIHQVDERVPVSEITQLTEVYHAMLGEFFGAAQPL